MVINRDMREATLLTMGGKDAYGQNLSNIIAQSTIHLTFGLYNHREVDDIRYQAITHTGLTKDVVNDNQIIVLDGKQYKVQFVNPYGRLSQLFLIAND